ncbi:MAG: hypothetical protein R6V10_06900 [bacterium]
MSNKVLTPGLATGIGSLPHTDMDAALDLVFKHLPDAPHWPQLQSLRYTEKMEVQPVEGLPGVKHLSEKKTVYVDTEEGENGLPEFYEKAMAAQTSGEGLADFGMSEDYAQGFHAFLERLKKEGKRFPLVKAQIIAPFSFGYSINDQEGKPVLFNSAWADALMKLLSLKSLWQIKLLSGYADKVLFFLDEPMLAAYGSTAMLTVSKDEVITRLNQVIEPLQEAGAVVGMHCCGNTDWGLIMQSKLDVLNFDAYNFGSTLAIYAEDVQSFLQKGGWLATGIIPTSEDIDKEDQGSLEEKLDHWIEQMGKAGVDRSLLRQRIIITPACGLGTLTEKQAEKTYSILSGLRKSYQA